MTKLLVILFLFVTGCQAPIANRASSGSTVVCFGDSLTAGFGATQGHDYPTLLSQKINFPVINAGVSGNTTRDALARLDKDVLSHDPRLVIITLGANDFFQGMHKDETLANMKKIIDRIKKRGAMVVWAEVKMGSLGDPYIDDFINLADQENVMLVPNILGGIMDDPEYKHDQIHPNDKGYEIMADRIYEEIKSLLSN